MDAASCECSPQYQDIDASTKNSFQSPPQLRKREKNATSFLYDCDDNVNTRVCTNRKEDDVYEEEGIIADTMKENLDRYGADKKNKSFKHRNGIDREDEDENFASKKGPATEEIGTGTDTEMHMDKGVKRKEIVSILNLVVDHVMMPPSPLEPDEFQWKRQTFQNQNQNQNLQCQFDADADADDGANDDCSMANYNAHAHITEVPVIRIFGPIIRGSGMSDVKSGGEAKSSENQSENQETDTGIQSQDQDQDQDQDPSVGADIPLIGTENRHHSKPRRKPQPQTQPHQSKMHQSGCLHIHGAFPYMLARPVKAGPDASSSFYQAYNKRPCPPSSNSTDRNEGKDGVRINKEDRYKDGDDGEGLEGFADEDFGIDGDADLYIDWDDQESVEHITDEIHAQLEHALRSHLEHSANANKGFGKGKEEEGQQKVETQMRFIRQVTVVNGRGFYTYCNGSIAPFIRVEYYNPAHRWRVKIMLERGLDLPTVAMGCDAGWNGSGIGGTNVKYGNANDEREDGGDALRFRCYEAHIPYTMQFFKDWNLAGMSWVKVGDGRFRNPIPHGIKDRIGKARANSTTDLEHCAENMYTMTHDKIPIEFHWSEHKYKEDVTTFGDSKPGQKEKMIKERRDWMGDEFWTRKETSCDLELDTTVMNLMNINDVMTSSPDDPEVHWRAVPSLREIWAEERNRMADLLPPKENFLSEEVETQFSKKEKVPKFTLSVKKGADRSGSLLALNGVQSLYHSSPGQEKSFRRAMTEIVEKHSASLTDIDARMRDTFLRKLEGKRYNCDPARKKMQETPDEAFAALEALIGQFSPATPMTIKNRLSLSQSPGILSSQIHSQPSPYVLSQAMSRAPLLTQADVREVEHDLEFCRNLERRGIDDRCIDPLTLTPYADENTDDFLKEEENMKEEEFERCLTMLATQEGASTSDKSLTRFSGNIIEDKPRDLTGFKNDTGGGSQNELEILTQSQIKHASAHCSGNGKDDGILTPMRNNSFTSKASSSFDTPQKVILGQDSQESDRNPKLNTPTTRIRTVFSLPNPVHMKDLLSSQSVSSTGEAGFGNLLQLKRKPPARMACNPSDPRTNSSAILWHPIDHGQNAVVPWLRFTSIATRTEGPNEGRRNVCSSGAFYEPVTRPPSASRMRRWLVRKRKQKQLSIVAPQAKRQCTRIKKIGPNTMNKHDLEFDENTRKLKVKAKKREKRVAFAQTVKVSTCTMHEVEEIDWNEMSQSMSQDSSKTLSQGDVTPAKRRAQTSEEVARPIPPKMPFSERRTTHTAISQQTSSMVLSENSENSDVLNGIGQQGGKLYVEGGGGLKTSVGPNSASSTMPNAKVTMMSIEVHVQCRTGRAGVNDSREIAMKPDPTRDPVCAISYVYGIDPGGGETIRILERCAIFVPTENELSSFRKDCIDEASKAKLLPLIGKAMGCSTDAKIEVVGNERQLLLRIASVVRWKDPDALMSWDTQGGGLGYLIERGLALGDKDKDNNNGVCIDMVRLLGRLPKYDKARMDKNNSGGLFDDAENVFDESKLKNEGRKWEGSGLGSEWDDRVGAGAGPSSIIGRLILNCWKIMSDEVKHPNASYQPAIVSAVLKKRIPYHDDLILTKWYGGDKGRQRWRVLKHRISQALANIQLFDALDVIGRAGEAARLSGVELSQSFPGIRGSQYKVEGVLLRALQSLWSDERGEKKGRRKMETSKSNSMSAQSDNTISQSQSPWKLRRNPKSLTSHSKTEGEGGRGYFFFSPSKNDCGAQEALECQAMTLEPQSGFHFDPIVVCDFTALYPSLVIAYNLCYSTCAGKLEYHSTRNEMKLKGRTSGKLGPFHYSEAQTAYVLKQHMKSLKDPKIGKSKDRAYCLPTGSIFVSEGVLKGVLPRVLDEILATRAMLKKASKEYKRLLSKPPKAVLRQLEARQLALKYVANVTYGYTSATFSGRSAMPLLADSIVECGRRTLTNAIMLANQWGNEKNGPWSGAKVVYGDTDSIFVKLPGRSVKEAFAFGREFCEKVTSSNPPPVQLKLEKVYMGTLLQTKKKYCGMKFDSPDQKVPTFEAKGIETIRKDQCALTQKILRNALMIIFKGKGLAGLKQLEQFLCRQWALIHAGRLPVSDFILTGRVRSQYRGKVGPVQAALAKRLAEADPGRIIRHKERLPYIIVASPGRSFKLRDCVLTPTELLAQWDAYTVHSHYYTTKHVNAALNRCFSLAPFKIDINSWYEAAPKPQKRIHHWPVTRTGNSTMISVYFGSDVCAICGQKSKTSGSSKSVICSSCRSKKNIAAFLALRTLNEVQQKAEHLSSICQQCNGCIENAGTYAVEKMVPQRKKFKAFSRSSHAQSTSSSTITLISAGVTSPISICTCIDCGITYKRHEMRESEIEALALCNSLRSLE